MPRRTPRRSGSPARPPMTGDRPADPIVRVVTVSECASHAVADARRAASRARAPEQSLARKLYRRLDEDWLLIADRNFFSWADWCAASDSGAQLLWRETAVLAPRYADIDAGEVASTRVVYRPAR
jgi:hypothetical protein